MTALSCFRRLVRSDRGVALTEFAFALPIFVLLLLGGLEVTNVVMTHMRINQIAITVADNAGRVRSAIDESNIYELFAGADLIGKPLAFKNNGRVILSSLEPNGKSGTLQGQMINWQRCYGSLPVAPVYGVQGKGRNDASLANGMGPATKRIKSADGTAVMFVEVTYRYKPVIFFGFGRNSYNIRYESAFNVRERTNQNITNTQGLTQKTC